MIKRRPSRARHTASAAAHYGGTFAKPEPLPRLMPRQRSEASPVEPPQLRFSSVTGLDGRQLVTVAGELDIATAEEAYSYLSDIIDHGRTPVSVDLSQLTFCDASGLSVLARTANRAREAGRQLLLTSVRPSLVKIMRITGLDRAFPEVCSPVRLP